MYGGRCVLHYIGTETKERVHADPWSKAGMLACCRATGDTIAWTKLDLLLAVQFASVLCLIRPDLAGDAN